MLVCLVFLQIFIVVAATCTVKDESGYKQAYCQNEGLTAVPKNLPFDIKRLDLTKNNLTTINGYAFRRYMYLKEIYIDENELDYLTSSAFYGLPLLRRLSMSGNKLHVSKAYPTGLFQPLSNLSSLDISRNMKKNKEDNVFYDIPVNELKSLRELSIDLVNPTKFARNFRELYQLQKLSFDVCYLKSLQNDTFTNLPGNITELHMTTCTHFFRIETNALSHFPKLSILDFTNSNIELVQALRILYPLQHKTMKGIFFRGVSDSRTDVILTLEMIEYISTICIKTLDLTNNNIVSVQKFVLSFKHPECLENLILSANRFALNRIAVDFVILFYKMINLKVLDYSYVPLEFKKIVYLNAGMNGKNEITFEQGSEDGNTTIIPTVTFPSNLEFIRITHVMAVSGIKEIRLINSSLNYFDVSYFETEIVPVFMFEGHNNLEYLDISGISSTKLKGTFPLLEHLKNLTMKQTELYKLIRTSESIFDWVPNLRKLDISHNYLWYIKANSFGDIHFLTHLNLSHNMFEIIPEVLTHFENVIEVDLTYNLVTTLQESIRNWIDHQQEKFGTFNLYLDKNALICSCETTDFLMWINNTKANLDSNKNYSCWMPDGKGKASYIQNVIEDYHNYFVDCNNKVWLKIGISLLSAITTLLICITVLYNFRWRIIFFFYRRFRRFAEKGLEVNFKYDVYISYSDDSALFVKQILAPKIEHEWGLKMCCEDRDFAIGESSADVRAISIHESRHIIFLVTPSFLRNEWSSFEIERAKYEKFSKDLQKIVVITKDIGFNNIPFEFATVWKDVFLIEWPIDKEGLSMTWQKLRLWFF